MKEEGSVISHITVLGSHVYHCPNCVLDILFTSEARYTSNMRQKLD